MVTKVFYQYDDEVGLLKDGLRLGEVVFLSPRRAKGYRPFGFIRVSRLALKREVH